MQNIRKKLLVIITILSMLFYLFGCQKIDSKDGDDSTSTPTSGTTAASVTELNPLTGQNNLKSSVVGKRPVAVVVENSPAARPQWGLGSADITVEGLVEGGITRMLWIYADPSSIPKVGPTRSARMDFVEIAEGFDAVFVHFGGAETAYAAIRNRHVDDIDGNGQGNHKNTAQYFARDNSRSGRGKEHTAYTTGEWLIKAISGTGVRYDINAAYSKPFSFNEKTAAYTSGTCASIKLEFSSSYRHTFTYNADDGLYYNHMNSSPMVDENGNQMAVSNVILLYFPSYKTINSAGSIDMDLSGGKGIIASNGTYENITWKKGNPSEQIKLYDSKGNELKLNTGKSYIGLIPNAKASLTAIS